MNDRWTRFSDSEGSTGLTLRTILFITFIIVLCLIPSYLISVTAVERKVKREDEGNWQECMIDSFRFLHCSINASWKREWFTGSPLCSLDCEPYSLDLSLFPWDLCSSIISFGLLLSQFSRSYQRSIGKIWMYDPHAFSLWFLDRLFRSHRNLRENMWIKREGISSKIALPINHQSFWAIFGREEILSCMHSPFQALLTFDWSRGPGMKRMISVLSNYFSFLFSIIIPNTSKQRMKIEREGKDRKITGKETVIHDSTFQALIWPFVRLGRWIKKERRKQIHDWLTAGSCPRGLIQNLSTISDQHALLRVLVNSMENKKDKGPWAETWIKRSLKLVNSSLDRTLRSMSSKPLDLFQFLC